MSLEPELLEHCKSTFASFDPDGTGEIPASVLTDALTGDGCTVAPEEISKLLESCDKSGDGNLSFPEYCGLVIKLLILAGLKAAFSAIDHDGSGSISSDEIKKLFEGLPQKLPDDKIEQLIIAADKDCSGTINFAEFVEAFLTLK